MTNTLTKTAFGVTTSEACTSGSDMLTACGGDFTIEKRQVSYQAPIDGSMGGVDSEGNIIPDMEWAPIELYVPVRSDTGRHIAEATVGDGFNILQNAEVIEIIDTICRDHSLNYQFMTLLSGGRGMAVQVECPDLSDALSIGTDQNKGRLTITNFHDGTGSLKVHVSLLRMFCRNVLPALNREFASAKRTKHRSVHSIKHSRKMWDRIEGMIAAYQEAMGDMINTADLLRRMAGRECSVAAKREYFKRLVNMDGKDESELSKRAKSMRENKMGALLSAARNPVNRVADAEGSWYEVMQAATYYSTHGMRVRNTGRGGDDEIRWTSAHLGAGAEMGIDALETALEMADIA